MQSPRTKKIALQQSTEKQGDQKNRGNTSNGNLAIFGYKNEVSKYYDNSLFQQIEAL